MRRAQVKEKDETLKHMLGKKWEHEKQAGAELGQAQHSLSYLPTSLALQSLSLKGLSQSAELELAAWLSWNLLAQGGGWNAE